MEFLLLQLLSQSLLSDGQLEAWEEDGFTRVGPFFWHLAVNFLSDFVIIIT